MKKMKKIYKLILGISFGLLGTCFTLNSFRSMSKASASRVVPTDYDTFYPNLKFSSNVVNNFIVGTSSSDVSYYPTNDVNSVSDLQVNHVYDLDISAVMDNLSYSGYMLGDVTFVAGSYAGNIVEFDFVNGGIDGVSSVGNYVIFNHISNGIYTYRFWIITSNGVEYNTFITQKEEESYFGYTNLSAFSKITFLYNSNSYLRGNNLINYISRSSELIVNPDAELESDDYNYLSVVSTINYNIDLYIKNDSYSRGSVENWCIRLRDFDVTSTIYGYTSEEFHSSISINPVPIVTGLYDDRNSLLWSTDYDYYYKEDFFTGNSYDYLNVLYATSGFAFSYLGTYDVNSPSSVSIQPLIHLNNAFQNLYNSYGGQVRFYNTSNPYVMYGGTYKFVTPFGYEFSIFVDSLYSNFGANTTNYDSGFKDGYSQGLTAGNNGGYDLGYADGYNDGSSQDIVVATIFNGILQVGMLPINFFLKIFNFEILGINLTSFVSALLSVGITLYVWRLLKGSKDD